MTPSEIQASYQRAQEILNGFKQPSTRLANDIVQLVKHISATQQTTAKPSEKGTTASEFTSFFGGVFK